MGLIKRGMENGVKREMEQRFERKQNKWILLIQLLTGFNDLQINEITQNVLAFFFYEAPYKHNRIVNEMITFLPLKVFTDYADMQKDSLWWRIRSYVKFIIISK